MATIKLYGNLAKYGKTFNLLVKSPQEAINALCYLIEGFRADFSRQYIKVEVDNELITNNQYKHNIQRQVGDNSIIHITPDLFGAGGNSGVVQSIIGAGLLVVGVYTGQTWLAQAGVALLMGGVVQMLTKPPNFSDKLGTETKKNRNTSFSNLENVVGQGQVVPLVYGTMLVGSRVVSMGTTSYAPHFLTNEEKSMERSLNKGKLVEEITAL